MLSLGMVWPKTYTSYVTVMFDEKAIIQPLMEGAAVATAATDRARLAREVINSRSFLNQIIEFVGVMPTDADPLAWDLERDRMRKRISIATIPPNLIRIEYRDKNPQRAYDVTARMADLFIQETRDLKASESSEAFAFIDEQVREYHQKLVEAERNLKDFRSENLDARPGTDAAISTRISQLNTSLEAATLELAETRIREKSIERQLSGEAALEVSLSREGQFQSQIAVLQGELDQLRLSYHETYPDIVRIKHQIEDLKTQISQEQSRREAEQQRARQQGRVYVDDRVRLSPVYQQLRQQLSDTRTQIATLEARKSELEQMLNEEINRGRRVHTGEMLLAELTRDYEVNRDIYRDLLRRRENARVSMSLDEGQQGLSLRVYEPAFLPLKPTGLRFLHFMILGLILAVLIPVAYLVARVQLDPRVRSVEQLTNRLGYRVLASVPVVFLPQEQAHARRATRVVMMTGMAVVAIYATAGILKLTGTV
jgi:polysaccharide chain length determinant protein (PEP-CTERM system associated)